MCYRWSPSTCGNNGVRGHGLQEGAIPPLLELVRGGVEEEQTHACRLLAILAQAVPTHGRFKELQVGAAPPEGMLGSSWVHCVWRGDTGGMVTHSILRPVHCVPRLIPTWDYNPSCPFQVVSALLPLLRGGRSPMVSEHAASVVAVLAQNPDLHFNIVGCGAVPAMVPLLFSGGHALQARLRNARHTHGFPHWVAISCLLQPTFG